MRAHRQPGKAHAFTGVKAPRPSRYGAVMWASSDDHAAGVNQLLISRSVYGTTLPVVRIVVTPARDRGVGSLLPMFEYIGGEPPCRKEHVVVHSYQRAGPCSL